MIDFSLLLYITKVRRVFFNQSQTVVKDRITSFSELSTNQLGGKFPDGKPIYEREWTIGGEPIKDNAIPETKTLPASLVEKHYFRVVPRDGDNISTFTSQASLDTQ